jgi:hypothetical protein
MLPNVRLLGAGVSKEAGFFLTGGDAGSAEWKRRELLGIHISAFFLAYSACFAVNKRDIRLPA